MSEFSRNEESFSRFVEEPLRRRGLVVRMALFYTACALFCDALALLAIYQIATGDGGFVVMLAIFGLCGFLTSFQAFNYLRDLNAKPVSLEGEIWRKWHKGNLFLFFMPSYYVNVQGKIFTITRNEYSMVLEDDLVRVSAYPHSLTVELLELYDETNKKFVPAASGATV
ncbi:MAG TPA: hypothetical protein VG845_01350 [Dehalococcoidia bacterium]|nr:hypothetical protein [Dehalococcoidia bacterium]